MNIRKVVVVNVISALMFVFGPQQAAAQNNPCAESRGKRVLKGSAGGTVVGGLLGGIFGGLKGAAIGAGAGAAAGTVVSIKKQAACSNPPTATKGPYNQTIADADEPSTSEGPGVLLRNVYGADRTTIEPILVQNLEKRGYGLVDEALYRQNGNSSSVQYYLDVIVRQKGNVQGSSGGGFFRSSWTQSGNQMLGRGIYQVSVVMINAQTGRSDRRHTTTMTISAVTYGSSNGNYTIANVYGSGSQSVWSSDPATGAAIAAINLSFEK